MYNRTAVSLVAILGTLALMLGVQAAVTYIDEYNITTTNITLENVCNTTNCYTIADLILDTDTDTTISNCSVDQSCAAILYDTDEANLNVNGSDWWDNYDSPTGWDLDSSNDLTTLTFWTGDLGGTGSSPTVDDDSHNHSCSNITGATTNLCTFDSGDYYTQAQIIGFNHYNASDFSITDYYTKAQIESLNYYNASVFSITDYYTKAEIEGFSHYNSTNPAPTYNTTYDAKPDTGTLTNGKICTWDAAGSEIDCDYTDLLGGGAGGVNFWMTAPGIPDMWPNTTAGGKVNINITNMTAENITLRNSMNLGCGNITGAASNLCTIVDTDTTISNCTVDLSCDPVAYDSELAAYTTRAEIYGYSYFNLSDFNIGDYYTQAQIIGFNHYNASDFSITDYYTKAQIESLNYYNASVFSITDYYTKAEIEGFSHYNSTNPAPTYNTTYDAFNDTHVQVAGDTMTGALFINNANITVNSSYGICLNIGCTQYIMSNTTDVIIQG